MPVVYIYYMRLIGKNTVTHFISLLAVLAVLAAYPLSGAESLSPRLFSPECEDGLYQLVCHFKDQVVEPAILYNADGSDFSTIGIAGNQRLFNFLRSIDAGNIFCFSCLKPDSTINPFDNKGVILIKLRI